MPYDIVKFKTLVKTFQDFGPIAQLAKGERSSLLVQQQFDIDDYLKKFHVFDSYCYLIADTSSMKFVKVGGGVEQLSGYREKDLLGKGYSIILKMHRLTDIISSVRGGIQYFKYLYAQPPENRPFIKVNRTLDMFRKNGEIIHILNQSIPILFNDKMQPVYMLNIISDITELAAQNRYTHYIIDSSDPKNVKKIDVFKSGINSAALQISPSELKVLKGIAMGYSSKRIAQELQLSEHTIKNHRKNMLRKLQCTNSSELIKLAMVKGWIE